MKPSFPKFKPALTVIMALLALLLLAGVASAAEQDYITTEDGAKIWHPGFKPGDKLAWSGGVDAEGYADGSGVYKLYRNGQLYMTVDGRMIKGKVEGNGKASWSDGSYYEGEFLGSWRHGKGYSKSPSGFSYRGDFAEGRFHGKGYCQWPSGSSYEGDWMQNKRSGIGKYTWPNGNYYEGGFLDSKYFGFGILYDKNGKVLKKGRWADGEYIGP